MILHILTSTVTSAAIPKSQKRSITLQPDNALPEYKKAAMRQIGFYEQTNGIISISDLIPGIKNRAVAQLLLETDNVYEAIKLSISPDETQEIVNAGYEAYRAMLDLEYA